MSYVVLNLTMLDKLSIVDQFSQVIENFLIINFIKNILILCLLKISHCHIIFIDFIYLFSKLNHHNIVQSINFYHNLVIWIIIMKNNFESEDFLKNVECNLTFLKSDKEYIFSDEMNERDSYFTIVIDESFIKVREI